MLTKVPLGVCVGAVCYQAGAYHVLQILKRLLAERGLDQQIELKGVFCFERCNDGIILEFMGRRFLNVRPETVENIFLEQILPRLVEKGSLDG